MLFKLKRWVLPDIYDILEHIHLDISENELKIISKMRNNLIHTASFLDEYESFYQYSYLFTQIGKMILGILGYKGKYVDWTKLGSNGSFENSMLSELVYHE